MRNPVENQTPEEIKKTVEEAIFNESETQKFKKKSQAKPGSKLEEEIIVESIINNL